MTTRAYMQYLYTMQEKSEEAGLFLDEERNKTRKKKKRLQFRHPKIPLGSRRRWNFLTPEKANLQAAISGKMLK